MPISLRRIEARDNAAMARIIRESLLEYDVPREGTVFSDPTTDDLYRLFNEPASVYFVAEDNGVLVGGCGIFPTAGLPEGYAELVKLYVAAAARGNGVGNLLMERCVMAARGMQYSHLYLESFPQLDKAVSMYIRAGFRSLDHSLGDSGHHACTIWMVKEL